MLAFYISYTYLELQYQQGSYNSVGEAVLHVQIVMLGVVIFLTD